MANILPGWGKWLNGGYQTEGGNDAFMAELLKYDPNAKLVGQGSYGGEGGGGGDAGYTLQYDASKLPGGGPQGVMDMNPDAFGDHGYRGHLFDPNAISQDPNYGAVTARSNLNTAADDKNIVDIIGPLVVGAATMGGSLLGTAPGMLAAGFNTAGSGAFAAGGGAAGGGFSGAGSNLLARALQNAPRLLGTARNMFSNPTGPSAPQQTSGMSPQMLAILRLLQQQGQQTGGN